MSSFTNKHVSYGRSVAGILPAAIAPSTASPGANSRGVPAAATRPDSSTTTWSAAASRAGRWVTATMVMRPRGDCSEAAT